MKRYMIHSHFLHHSSRIVESKRNDDRRQQRTVSMQSDQSAWCFQFLFRTILSLSFLVNPVDIWQSPTHAARSVAVEICVQPFLLREWNEEVETFDQDGGRTQRESIFYPLAKGRQDFSSWVAVLAVLKYAKTFTLYRIILLTTPFNSPPLYFLSSAPASINILGF